MRRKLGNVLRILLLATLILSVPGAARTASNAQTAKAGTDDVPIEIGSTYSFGQTHVGTSVSRSFRLENKDTTRSMRIYGVWIKEDPNHPQWAILQKPKEDDWIPPGGSAELTISFIAYEPGVHEAVFSWYVEMKPVSEEDEDNFFVFSVTGEALENQDPEISRLSAVAGAGVSPSRPSGGGAWWGEGRTAGQ